MTDYSINSRLSYLISLNKLIWVVLLLSLTFSSGCGFIEMRMKDLGHCFRFSIDYGLGAEITCQVGPLECTVGSWGGSGITFINGSIDKKDLKIVCGVPITQIGAFLMPIFAGNLGSYESTSSRLLLIPIGLFATSISMTGDYDKSKEYFYGSVLFARVIPYIYKKTPFHKMLIDQSWIRVSVHLFIGIEIGLNVIEIIDFLFGLFGVDLLEDDE